MDAALFRQCLMFVMVAGITCSVTLVTTTRANEIAPAISDSTSAVDAAVQKQASSALAHRNEKARQEYGMGLLVPASRNAETIFNPGERWLVYDTPRSSSDSVSDTEEAEKANGAITWHAPESRHVYITENNKYYMDRN